MDEIVTRFFENLVGRVHGQMNFRLICQPLMAAFYAIRDGRIDARDGRALFAERKRRLEMLRHGWESVGKIFVVALTLEVVYQFITFRWFYLGEALVTAPVLAIIPYLLLRDLVNRLNRVGHGVSHAERLGFIVWRAMEI